ncbi:hypothetical protein [Cobetia marina]|uniref:hypothetical protein n=1 Tax=Cobetia marina TaxID=28258 RepID=UPI0012F51193|nr:hypothetical protein [Cobetia marina]
MSANLKYCLESVHTLLMTSYFRTLLRDCKQCSRAATYNQKKELVLLQISIGHQRSTSRRFSWHKETLHPDCCTYSKGVLQQRRFINDLRTLMLCAIAEKPTVLEYMA